MTRVALVGDYNASVIAHQAIPEALRLAGGEGVWVETRSIEDAASQLAEFDGIWCVPASPYANTAGALAAIRFARVHGRPFLGSCGGFQHALIEYARNVLGLSDADHAETNPSGHSLVVTPLACALVEQSEEIRLAPGSRVQAAYGCEWITEGYHCTYGANPEYAGVLFGAGLRPAAYDPSGQVRAAELEGHPFFVGTLFQSERRALRGEVPPLVAAFVRAMAR